MADISFVVIRLINVDVALDQESEFLEIVVKADFAQNFGHSASVSNYGSSMSGKYLGDPKVICFNR